MGVAEPSLMDLDAIPSSVAVGSHDGNGVSHPFEDLAILAQGSCVRLLASKGTAQIRAKNTP